MFTIIISLTNSYMFIIFVEGICYAEFISISATSGGCYRYVYYAMGEIMAFLVGWSVIFTCSMSKFIINKTLAMNLCYQSN